MSKKKFKDTKVGAFLTNAGSNIVDVVGDVLPDNGVLGIVKGLLDKDDTLPPQDKETALKLLEMDSQEMKEVTKRWEADLSATGTWLTKNVRPLTLVFFSVAYVAGWYLEYPLDSVQSVLSLIVGAYFGSRGVEKVMGNNKHK
jgi:hypothetical protein